jgi:type II secretory pathway component PulF
MQTMTIIALVLSLINVGVLLYLFLGVLPKIQNGFKDVEEGMTKLGDAVLAITSIMQK